MRKKIEWQWEKLDESTQRAKVIGGWLVMHFQHTTFTGKNNSQTFQTESMAFVMDRDHEWAIAAPFDPSVTSKAAPKVNASDFESPK